MESLRFYFVSDENGNLILDRSLIEAYERSLTPLKQLFQTLKSHSYLASLISERWFLLKQELHRARFQADHQDIGTRGDNRKVDEFSRLNIYLPNMSPAWQEAFEITKRIILKLRASVEARGGQFVMVTLSNAEQVHPEMAEQLNREHGIEFDYEQPDRTLAEFARRESLTLLQLMPAFRNYHTKTGTYLHGFGSSIGGHWNENGHRLAAEEIIKFLVEKHLVPVHRTT
jgi:hypothetical protein